MGEKITVGRSAIFFQYFFSCVHDMYIYVMCMYMYSDQLRRLLMLHHAKEGLELRVVVTRRTVDYCTKAVCIVSQLVVVFREMSRALVPSLRLSS